MITITEELRAVEAAFTQALRGELGPLESLTQSAAGITEQFASTILGTKAVAEIKGAFDAALSVEYMAQFIGSMGTDIAALGASLQYCLAAADMFKVAGGGGGGRSSGGAYSGSGGSQSSYGRGGGSGTSAGGRGGGGGASSPRPPPCGSFFPYSRP